MALIAPLVANLYDRGRSRAVLRGLVLITALAVMTGTILTNVQKPLVGPQAIWGKTRRERRTVLWGSSNIPVLVIYDDMPRKGRVATILRSTNPEYVWFGEDLNRTLTPIFPPPAVVDLDWLKKNRYDVVVVANAARLSRADALPPKQFNVYRRPPHTIVIRVK
jgi:hypothetical protein